MYRRKSGADGGAEWSGGRQDAGSARRFRRRQGAFGGIFGEDVQSLARNGSVGDAQARPQLNSSG